MSEGKDLVLNLGFSHPVWMAVPEGLNGAKAVSTPAKLCSGRKAKLGRRRRSRTEY